MSFSNFIIYVDESGDHSLTSIDENYPVFVLSFCIFEKARYSAQASRDLQDFKFRWFGHDSFVLHESDIVKRRFPFGFLQFDEIRERFLNDLSAVLETTPMTVIAALIRKDALKRRYTNPENPYQLALLFCLEKANEFLRFHDDRGESPSTQCTVSRPEPCWPLCAPTSDLHTTRLDS